MPVRGAWPLKFKRAFGLYAIQCRWKTVLRDNSVSCNPWQGLSPSCCHTAQTKNLSSSLQTREVVKAFLLEFNLEYLGIQDSSYK